MASWYRRSYVVFCVMCLCVFDFDFALFDRCERERERERIDDEEPKWAGGRATSAI